MTLLSDLDIQTFTQQHAVWVAFKIYEEGEGSIVKATILSATVEMPSGNRLVLRNLQGLVDVLGDDILEQLEENFPEHHSVDIY